MASDPVAEHAASLAISDPVSALTDTSVVWSAGRDPRLPSRFGTSTQHVRNTFSSVRNSQEVPQSSEMHRKNTNATKKPHFIAMVLLGEKSSINHSTSFSELLKSLKSKSPGSFLHKSTGSEQSDESTVRVARGTAPARTGCCRRLETGLRPVLRPPFIQCTVLTPIGQIVNYGQPSRAGPNRPGRAGEELWAMKTPGAGTLRSGKNPVRHSNLH